MFMKKLKLLFILFLLITASAASVYKLSAMGELQCSGYTGACSFPKRWVEQDCTSFYCQGTHNMGDRTCMNCI